MIAMLFELLSGFIWLLYLIIGAIVVLIVVAIIFLACLITRMFDGGKK